MMVSSGKCVCCGWCCKTSRSPIEIEGPGGKLKMVTGILLFPGEVSLFPAGADYIKPYWGRGKAPKIRPVSYQVDTERCPLLSPDNLCTVYERRPLTCRAYPINLLEMIQDGGYKSQTPCNIVHGFMGSLPADIVEAHQTISDRMMNSGFTWIWDLETSQWVHNSEITKVAQGDGKGK